MQNGKIKYDIEVYCITNDKEKSKFGWSNFFRRNQSILVDLFYGQLKSCVICPECNYNSINFNSFLSLELSINSDKNYQIINITFIDYFQESPNINSNIILYQNEKKIYFVRKKLANLLNIDLLSFPEWKQKTEYVFKLAQELNVTQKSPSPILDGNIIMKETGLPQGTKIGFPPTLKQKMTLYVNLTIK